jgi:hypothetical protein
MRSERGRITFVASFISLLVVIGAGLARAQGDDRCEHSDDNPPPQINGRQGGSTGSIVQFSYSADAEPAAQRFSSLFHVIRNENQDRTLTVQWTAGGIDATRLDAKGHICTTRDVPDPISRDDASEIAYGPTLQDKQRASAYVEGNSSKQRHGPKLTTKLHADVSNFTIDLSFSAEVKDRQLSYTVTNDGKRDIYFEIPELTRVLAKLEEDKTIKATETWSRTGLSRFLAKAANGENRATTYTVSLSKDVPISFKSLSMKVYSASGEHIAGGEKEDEKPLTGILLSVYLPGND